MAQASFPAVIKVFPRAVEKELEVKAGLKAEKIRGLM